MKKILLIPLLTVSLFCSEKPLWNKSRLELFLQTDLSNEDFIYGGKIIFPYTEFRYSQKDDNMNFGLELNTEKLFKNSTMIIQAGNLSAGGSLSKLNNPLVSGGTSPFSQPATTATSVSTSLTGYSTFSNKPGISLQYNYQNKKSSLSKITGTFLATPETQRYVLSSGLQVKLPNKTQVESSITAGFFSYDENSSGSWFISDNHYFHQGNHFCTLIQNSLTFQNTSILFSTNIYENPFGYFSVINKVESKIKIKRNTISTSFYFNPENFVISSAEKKLDKVFQAKAAWKYQFTSGKNLPVISNIGFCSLGNFNIKTMENDLKISTGYQVSSIIMSLLITASMDSIISQKANEKFSVKNYNIQIKNNWYIKSFSTGINLAASISTPVENSTINTSEKLSLNFGFTKNPKISSTATLNLSQKNGESTKKTVTNSINLRFFLINRINCIGKLSVVIEF